MSIKDRWKEIKWFTKTSVSYMTGVYSENKFINLLYVIPELPYTYYLYLKHKKEL